MRPSAWIRLLWLLVFVLVAGRTLSGQDQAEPLWEFRPDFANFQLAPTFGPDGTLYAPSASTMYAVRPDGTQKWAFRTGLSIRSSPSVAPDGTLYFTVMKGSSDSLYALGADGSLKWTLPTVYSGTPPAIGRDGSLHFASTAGVYCLRSDGSHRFYYPETGAVFATPSIGPEGSVFLGNSDGAVFAFNSDGTLKWRYTTSGAIMASPALAADGTVYVGSRDHRLYAIASDGSLLWSFLTQGEILSSPAIGPDGTVYFGSDDRNLYALSPDGILKWALPTEGEVRSSPTVGGGGFVVFTSTDGKAYGVGFDGELLGYFETRVSDLHGSVLLGPDGIMYLSAGSLFAIDTESEQGLAESAWPMQGHDVHRTSRSSLIVDEEPSLIFPQFANGEVSGTRNRTRIVLRNNGDWEETGKLTFRNPQGDPVEVPIADVNMTSLEYRIAPWGVLDISTDGLGALETGVVEVLSYLGKRSRLTGTEIFELMGTFVSVPGSRLLGSHRLYVRFNPAENTGFAVYNSNRRESIRIGLSLLDSEGIRLASRPLILRPGEQKARFIDEEELFQGYFQAHTGPFVGTLELQVEQKGQVAIVGLVQKRANGALMAVSPFSPPKGSPKWFHNPADGEPAVGHDGTIYTLCYGNICAIRPDGSLRWTKNLQDADAKFIVVGSEAEIYTIATDGTLRAISPEGATLWSYSIGKSCYGLSVGIDGTAYLSCLEKILAVSAGGVLKWTQQPDDSYYQFERPVSIGSDGTIYALAEKLYAFTKDGASKWSVGMNYGTIPYSPAIGHDGSLLFTQGDQLFSLDPNGTLNWSFPLPNAGWPTAIAVGPDGSFYFSSGARLIALGRDGQEQWHLDTSAQFHSAPTVGSDGSVYFLANDQTLRAVGPDGILRWAVPIGYWWGSGGTSVTLVQDGTLYLIAGGSALQAFDTGSGTGLAHSSWPIPRHDAGHSGASSSFLPLPAMAFPQFASGEAGGGRNRTRIILRNNQGPRQQGQVRFQNSQGNPLAVSIGGLNRSTVAYNVATKGTVEVETDGTGPLQTGAVEVEVTSNAAFGLQGTEIFEILGNSVSLEAGQFQSTHQVFVSVDSRENTGIAVFNPDKSRAAVLKMALLDKQGQVKSTRQLVLPPGEQTARFVDEAELFQDFFQTSAAPFQGTLNVAVDEGLPVALVGLIQQRLCGALMSVATSPNVFVP